MTDWSHSQWLAWLRSHKGALRFHGKTVEVRIGKVKRESHHLTKAMRRLYEAIGVSNGT